MHPSVETERLFIQVVSRAMALAAFGELGVHGRRMRRFSVAALTLRDHLVFCLMAGRAQEFGVLERTGGQLLVSTIMAGCAGLGRS